MISAEGLYPLSYVTEDVKFDNFTVVLMLSEAAHGGNPITESLRTPYYGDSDMLNSMPESIKGNVNTAYPRYWHGYLVLLKPLLLFFNVKEIRLLFQTLFIILLGVSSIALYRSMGRQGLGIAIALCLSMGLIGCADAAATLPIFFSFAISLGAVIWVALQPITRVSITGESPMKEPTRTRTPPSIKPRVNSTGDHLAGRQRTGSRSPLPFGFMVIGALTVYFDFLDNPVITLGIPLVVLVCRIFCYETFPQALKLCAACSLFWVIGYGGAWVAKWALASLVLGEDVFASAADAIQFRTGMNDDLGFFERIISVFQLNYEQIGIVRWLLKAELAALLVMIAILLLRCKNSTRTKALLYGITLLLIVSLVPLVWYVATSNHSMIHVHIIAYRTLVVQLFALSAAVVVAIGGFAHSPSKPNQLAGKERSKPTSASPNINQMPEDRFCVMPDGACGRRPAPGRRRRS